jgi:hypothetical protein
MKRCTVSVMSFLCAWLFWGSDSHAAMDEGAAFNFLMGIHSLKCTYTLGSNAKWHGEKVQVKSIKEEMILYFDSINYKGRTARAIGNQMATDVQLLLTPRGVSFLEETGSGNLIINTLFPVFAGNTKKFTAVMSRHLMMINDPIPSQWHGTCEAWE